MTVTEDVLKPSQTFFVTQGLPLTSQEQEVLEGLYLPLVGSIALSLYQFFAFQSKFTDPQPHFQLLTRLDLGLQNFLTARYKLEALGLLRSFVTPKNEYHYQLVAPISARQFLQDDIFSHLLLGKIGEKDYQMLAQYFLTQTATSASNSEEIEITTSFQGSFDLSQAQMSQPLPITIGEVQEVRPPATKIDWLFLADLLAKQGLKLKQLTGLERTELVQLADLYGYDDFTLGKLLVETADDDGLNLKKLKQAIAKNFNAKLQTIAAKPSVPANEERFAGLRQQGFSAAELQFIQTIEKISPMDFLAAIKKQKGGFVADQERYLLEQLRRRSTLSDGVLNILIDYVLRQQNQASLQASYVNTIANDWAQNKVQLPEDAMVKIKELIGKSQQSKEQRYGRKNNNSPQRKRPKEELPDWVDKPMTETEMDEKDKEAFLKRIEKLKESR